jgi:pSer/pThr/pTyr-binding forkhead associated (FHA) protein
MSGRRLMTKDDETRPTEVMGLDARLAKAVPEEPQVVGFLLAGDGLQPGRVFPLSRNSTLIGRADNADIRLAHAAVSGEHARITTVGLGFEIEDLGSVNGTFVNGQRITRGKLQRGDRLLLGSLEFTFLVEKSRDSKAALLAPGQQRRTALLTNLRPAALRSSSSDDDEGMSYGDMVRSAVGAWKFVRGYLRLAGGLAVLGLGLGVVSVFVLPAASSAVAFARLDAKRKLNPLEKEGRSAAEGDAEFFLDPERAFVAPLLVRDSLQKIGKPAATEEALTEVQERLDIKPDGERVFKATYKAPLLTSSKDPDPAAFLDLHLNSYIQADIARGLLKLESETKYLNEKLASTTGELQRINEELATYKEEHAEDLPEYASSAQTSRITLENRRTELTAELSRKQAELRAEDANVGERALKEKDQAAADTRTALLAAKRRLAVAKAKDLGDAHPDVVQINQEIERLQALIKDLMGRGDDSLQTGEFNEAQSRSRKATLEAQIAALRIELRDTEKALASAKDTMRKSPKVGARLADLQTQHDNTKKIHEQLSAEAHRATLQLDLERVSVRSRWDIVTAARVTKPSQAKTFAQRGTMGIGLALGLAVLIAALREARKHVQPEESSSSSALMPRA